MFVGPAADDYDTLSSETQKTFTVILTCACISNGLYALYL